MEKSEFKALKEQLFSRRRNGFDRLDGAERGALEAYCADYKAFLDAGKTERLCAAEAIRLAEQAGYRPYVRGTAVKAGRQGLSLQPGQERAAGPHRGEVPGGGRPDRRRPHRLPPAGPEAQPPV